LLSREKRYFYNDAVYRCQVEKYAEFSVKRLLGYVKDKPVVMIYLPDVNMENPRMMPREFLINIMATLDPDFFDKATNEAKNNRIQNHGEEVKEIEVEPRLAKALSEFINLRKIGGRSTVGHLKPNAKPRKRPVRRDIQPLVVLHGGKKVKRNPL
jgi:hypothetical protein